MAAIQDIIRYVAGDPQKNLGWRSLSSADNYYDAALDAATNFLVDTVIRYGWARESFKAIMLATSHATAVNAHGGQGRQKPVPRWLQITSWIGESIISPGGSVITATAASIGGKGGQHFQSEWEAALMMPNIGGVPISTLSVESDRSVDISEQLIIQQDTGEKKYWTDNAVPRLKDWNIEGYITPALSIDQGLVIKPSLDFQANFLDRCALTRKPVLFKTDRGEFVFVQITNLKTTTEASYNNAIKVSISLKEFNPLRIHDNTGMEQQVDRAKVKNKKAKTPEEQIALDADPMGGASKGSALSKGSDLATPDSALDIPGTRRAPNDGWSIDISSSQYGVNVGAKYNF